MDPAPSERGDRYFIDFPPGPRFRTAAKAESIEGHEPGLAVWANSVYSRIAARPCALLLTANFQNLDLLHSNNSHAYSSVDLLLDNLEDGNMGGTLPEAIIVSVNLALICSFTI
jgi:hypothetical protein